MRQDLEKGGIGKSTTYGFHGMEGIGGGKIWKYVGVEAVG